MKFRKKPVVIEAWQWKGRDMAMLNDVLGMNWGRADAHDIAWGFENDKEQVVIYNTLEKAWIPCPVGHWIIRGLKGEFYPCEDSVFQASYEAVPHA